MTPSSIAFGKHLLTVDTKATKNFLFPFRFPVFVLSSRSPCWPEIFWKGYQAFVLESASADLRIPRGHKKKQYSVKFGGIFYHVLFYC